MKCSKCFSNLKETIIEGVKVDYCESCEGIFYDKNEFEELILNVLNENKTFLREILTQIKETEDFKEKNKLCPKDNKIMRRIEYPVNSKIIIDYCPKCKSVWTDKSETEKVLKWLMKNENMKQQSEENVWEGASQAYSVSIFFQRLLELFN